MGYYDDTMAEITREQWEDYKKRFMPHEDRLLELADSDELLNKQLERNQQNVAQAFNAASMGETMRGSRYGLSDVGSTQQKTNTGLQEAIATASVQNQTRQAVEDTKRKMITGQGGGRPVLGNEG